MCSGIRIIAKDGTIVCGRTLEFGPILKFKKYATSAIKGTSTIDGKIIDGINRAGLQIMAFYFPKCATYAPSPDFKKTNVKPTDLAMMLLERCKTCDEVEIIAPKINVIHEKYPPFPTTPEMHWLVTDASGKSIVLEPEDGGLSVYQNHLGIFTNSPSFPEHLEEAATVLEKISQFSNPNADSQGTGAVSLPGDFSSKSRFDRLAFFADTIVQPQNGTEAINSLIHILNNFDILKGVVASVDPQTKKITYETTIYTVYYNITTRQVLFKDYNDQSLQILN
jgi:choloylglycine hydrolase